MKAPKKYQFIVQLGKFLHKYGVPSYKIQNYLEQVAEQQGIKGSYMDMPTQINYVFYEEDEEQTYNYVERVLPGEWNLGALSKAVEITDKYLANEIDSEEAQFELEKINSKKPGKRLKLLQAIAFATSSGAFSIILGVNMPSAILAAFLGFVVFGIILLAKRSNYIESTIESLAPFIVTSIVGITSMIYPHIHISLTVLASIIVFIPGLAITTALEEITSRSLVSGTAKLFDAIVSLFKQFFGVVLALVILQLFGNIDHTPVPDDIPDYVNYIAIIFLAMSLIPVFEVQKKDIIYGIATGIIGYNIAVLLWPAGILLSAFVGTIIIVLISHLFGRITKTPIIVYLTQGIIMLVPGSKAFIGLSSALITKSSAIHMWEQVGFILMGVIGGLLFTGSFTVRKKD